MITKRNAISNQTILERQRKYGSVLPYFVGINSIKYKKMKEPTIEELQLTLKYLINPHVYDFNEKMTALATMMYCQHAKTTPQELLEEIQKR